jgi:hypothetical protein
MGSRRSYSVSAVVGKGREVASEKAAVTRAIKEADPSDIASATARLIAKSEKTGDFFVHGLKLMSAIRELAQQSAELSPRDLDQKVRTTWAEIKKEKGVPADPALDKAVIDAAKAAIKGRKR